MGELYEVQNVIRMAILMHTNFTGIQHINTLYFATRGHVSIGPEHLEALEDDFGTTALNQYLDIFPDAFEMYQMDTRGVYGDVPPGRSGSFNENGSRDVEGDYLPPYCCSVLSFKPNFASKRWHGKNFYGGLVEADQVNGSLQTGVQAAVGAFAVAMINRYGESGLSAFQWVVLSDPSHALPSLDTVGDPGVITPVAAGVDSYHVGSFVRTQKRRDFFRGN